MVGQLTLEDEMIVKWKARMQVRYMPPHANQDPEHKDVQFGFITSVYKGTAFVRYWLRDITDLRTTSCSELTQLRHLEPFDSVDPKKIEEIIITSNISINTDGDMK